MRAQTRMLTMTLAAGLASSALATDRYWTAPLIGAWSDGGNWSLSSGGSPAGGLPQNGDDIFFDDRSICIFNGAGILIPSFGEITLSGSFAGVTSLQQGSGPWNASRMTIGLGSDDCEFKMGGGSFIVSEMLVGKEPGGVGELETSGTAEILITSVVNVGQNGAVGDVAIGGNLFEFNDMNISFGFGNPGLGHVDVLAGTVLGDEISVGLDGDGTLSHSGGDIDVNGYIVGRAESSPASTSVHTGGTLDVSGFLQIAPVFGDGTMAIDGADVSCGTLYMGEGPGANAVCTLSSGSLSVTTARIGIEGLGRLNQVGGTLTAGSVEVGDTNTLLNMSEWTCFGGAADVAGDITIGAGYRGWGDLIVDGGVVSCDSLSLSVGSKSRGNGELAAGSLSANTINIGVTEYGQFIQSGGALSATTLNVGFGSESSIYRMTGPDFGTFACQTINNHDRVEVFGGVIAATTLNNSATGDFRMGNSPDVRIPTVVNGGVFTFGTASATLSGVFTGPPLNLRLLGSFENNGTLEVTSTLAANFSMNLINHGVVDVLGNNNLDANGSIVNHAQINVDAEGGSMTATLQCDHSLGIDNQGTIHLNQGVVRTSTGEFVNNGLVEGSGRIEGGLINNARIGRGGQLSELLIQDGYSSSSTSTLEFQRYPGAHNTIRVGTGDAQLAGALEVDFEFFDPALGAEYVLITTDTGNVVGTFDTVSITDAYGEVVYEPTRVIVRVTGCNGADLAMPLGSLDFSDVIAFLSAFGAMEPEADLAAPFGQWDFSDVIAFLGAFGAGCP